MNYNLIVIYLPEFPYLLYVAAILFAFSFIVQMVFYLGVFSRIKKAGKDGKQKGKDIPISVIICARNEEENLRKNLEDILTQKHSDYEVIVVNDCSTDDSELVVGSFIEKYKHLKTTTIVPDKKFSHGKKLALTIGIKAAKNEWLVLTDADCKPAGDLWLKKLQQHFTDDKSIVLGYGGYFPTGSLLNGYIRYDTMIIAMQYLSFALLGEPYMGVGRNMAYRKSLFFDKKGFATHYDLYSGDDDLFVNENATGSNTAVEISKGSFTMSEAKRSLHEWFTQKKRHMTTSRRYRFRHKFLLGMETISRGLFYMMMMILLFFKFYYPVVLGLVLVRMLVQLSIYKIVINKLKERNIWLPSILFDVISLFINFIIYLSSSISARKLKWN
jgi:poly-beta-1,6-N-acetyl-D-glucosamine synthase